MDALFTCQDTWNGGHYGLAIELPRTRKRETNHAISYLWSHPSLDGCYLRSDLEPNEQPKFPAPLTISEGHFYGVATLPNGKLCACGSFVADYDKDGCWLEFYIPLGTLGNAYPVAAYPFLEESVPSPEPWIRKVNDWFKDIAIHLFRNLRFGFAMIGFEVNFFDARKSLGSEVPEERWDSFLIREENDELKWYPQTIFQPPHALKR